MVEEVPVYGSGPDPVGIVRVPWLTRTTTDPERNVTFVIAAPCRDQATLVIGSTEVPIVSDPFPFVEINKSGRFIEFTVRVRLDPSP